MKIKKIRKLKKLFIQNELNFIEKGSVLDRNLDKFIDFLNSVNTFDKMEKENNPTPFNKCNPNRQ